LGKHPAVRISHQNRKKTDPEAKTTPNSPPNNSNRCPPITATLTVVEPLERIIMVTAIAKTTATTWHNRKQTTRVEEIR